jgi:excisionase family DNA binding protein
MSTILPDNLVHADPAEQQEIERLRGRIDEIYHVDGKALLVGPVGEEPVELPVSAFAALRFVVDAMANGQTILLIPHGKELTTQQAADMLHVSRPHVVKLCDAAELPFHRVGKHRRIRIEDLLAYRERRATTRRAALRRLTELSEAVDGGYATHG